MKVCEILLENGADMDHADKEGKTALFAAAREEYFFLKGLLAFFLGPIGPLVCGFQHVLNSATE